MITPSHIASYTEQKITTASERFFHFEPAVLVEDMNVHDMVAHVKLKRKLVTGHGPRVKAPADIAEGFSGQEAESVEIFRCNVLHSKNKHGMSRVRYYKGDDITVLMTDRAKDFLVKSAHQFNIDPIYNRQKHVKDAFVLLGFQCDEGEAKAPDTPDAEGDIFSRSSKPEYGKLRSDDWLLYWGRKDSPGYTGRFYITPESDFVAKPAAGRHVILQEGAKNNILKAQPVAKSYNGHLNFGIVGPATGPTIPGFHFKRVAHWSEQHWVDNNLSPAEQKAADGEQADQEQVGEDAPTEQSGPLVDNGQTGIDPIEPPPPEEAILGEEESKIIDDFGKLVEEAGVDVDGLVDMFEQFTDFASGFDELPFADELKDFGNEILDKVKDQALDLAKDLAMDALNSVVPAGAIFAAFDVLEAVMTGNPEAILESVIEGALESVPGAGTMKSIISMAAPFIS